MALIFGIRQQAQAGRILRNIGAGDRKADISLNRLLAKRWALNTVHEGSEGSKKHYREIYIFSEENINGHEQTINRNGDLKDPAGE